jgi:hypothetical protein
LETVKVKLSLCLIKHHATKMYEECKYSFKHFYPRHRWEWSASHPGRFTQWKKNLRYPLDRKLGGTQRRSGWTLWRTENYLTSPGNRTPITTLDGVAVTLWTLGDETCYLSALDCTEQPSRQVQQLRSRLVQVLERLSVRNSARTFAIPGFSWFYSVPLGKRRDNNSIRPQPLPWKSFPLYQSSYHSTLYTCSLEKVSVVK